MSNLFHDTSAAGRGRYSQSSAVQEKLEALSQRPLPPAFTSSANPRNIRVRVVNPARVRSIPRFGRREFFTRCCTFLGGLFAICVVVVLLGTEENKWTPTFRDSTLVFNRDELQRIWQWEIESGHHPSYAKIPEQIGFTDLILNPALPPAKAHTPVSSFTLPVITTTRGVGPQRIYHIIRNLSQDLDAVAYPPRPITGSVADFDIILDHCSFVTGKFVRDCLEFLRTGAGLDNGRRVRRGSLDGVKYIYTEEGSNEKDLHFQSGAGPRIPIAHSIKRHGHNAGLQRKRGLSWEAPLNLSPMQRHPLNATSCDSRNPRLFHMYWAGPFDDKPYTSLLSFLFTQNLGLHFEDTDGEACRPQFWVWINPYPAAATPTSEVLTDIYQSLETNPWAAPFLHPRFKGIIEFKLWNTTEQLDSIPELRDGWRSMNTIFKSNGAAIRVPRSNSANHPGSKSQSLYDKLSVVLSDMARFTVTHRFGGIYVDADTLFLRDWEELWGWQGAFAYRWSFHNFYNTAVLHLNKGSALGSFLFRTALKNGFDFHPSSVTRYLKDAHLSPLLTQLPDALFDPAWLNAEGYQRARPPQPFFTSFTDFFDTPADQGAAPLATGFDGFFRGAFSYHYHNSWWRSFDAARDWPDLGPRFWEGERVMRAAARPDVDPEEWVDRIEDDKVDLDWAAALKRTFESYMRGERPNMYGEWLRLR